MFIGHFAVGFAGKRAAPSVSLGTLFLACAFLDVLFPLLLLLGIETVRIAPGITAVSPLEFVSYPYSHSLAAALLWSAVFGVVYWAIKRDRRSAVILGAIVASHWVLDFVSHAPDLPLAPGMERRFGLGLWNSMAGTLVVELLLFAVGVSLYARATRARDRIGRFGLWGLVGFLVMAYLTSAFGPPPPGVVAIAWVGQSVWLLIVWGYWVDRHRSST